VFKIPTKQFMLELGEMENCHVFLILIIFFKEFVWSFFSKKNKMVSQTYPKKPNIQHYSATTAPKI